MTTIPRPRRGFTLLELMVALTLTAIAAGIAGTAVTAARRTSEVITAHQGTDIADAQLRAMLTDMLRHAPDGALVDGSLLVLDGDAAAPRLEFVSRGVRAPFGTGPVWRVTLVRTADTLRLEARPVRASSGLAPITATVTGVTALSVEVLESATATDAPRWQGAWALVRQRPAAVAIQWQRRGGPATAPLVVSLDPLGSVGP